MVVVLPEPVYPINNRMHLASIYLSTSIVLAMSLHRSRVSMGISSFFMAIKFSYIEIDAIYLSF
jgi:hypothetical protein